MLFYNCDITFTQSNVLSDLDIYIPKNITNITSNPNFKLSEEIQVQINLFDYLYINDISTISTNYDHIEPLFTAKLFYNEGRNITINHISQYDNGSKYSIPHQYIYDNNGDIIKILNLEDSKYKMEFFYQNGHLTNIKNYSTSIPMTITQGHNVTHTQPEIKVDEVLFTYNNELLISENYLTNPAPKYSLQRGRDYFYYQDKNNPSLKYFKYVDKSMLKEERLICFENNRIKYVTYSYKPSFNENSAEIQQVLLFTYNDNLIEIKHYEPNNKTGKITLSRKYEMQVGENSRVESIKASYRLAISPNIKETYFQYHYSQNKLIGYEIFERTIYGKDKSPDQDYELSEAFYLVSK